MSGIKQQTLLVALIPILLATFLFGSYGIYTRFSDADNALIEHSKSITQQLAISSEYALFSGNIELLEKEVDTQLKNNEVKSIQIVDANEKLLISSRVNPDHTLPQPGYVSASNPIKQDSATLTLYEEIYPTRLDLQDPNDRSDIPQNQKLGAIIIEFNKSGLNHQKFEMLLVNFIVMAGVLLITVLAALWKSRRISNPILSISRIIKQIGSGNLVARVPEQTNVLELNELARNINEMARQLQDDRDLLEQRILSATQDLRSKKEEAEKEHEEVQNLNDKLSRAFIELENKEHAKTRFLAAAGHDLRQPVAAATLFVESLKYSEPTLRQSELIAKLDQSMKVFSVMLERLLDISKLDAGLIKPTIKTVDLLDLFDWLDRTFSQSAINKDLQFRLIYPINKSLHTRTDLALLQSILMNLVSNAIKYTEHGGIMISARIRGKKVLLQVWDTGIGIHPDDLPHVFDEFYQVGNQHRNREGGLGLGLSICQRSIALLNSQISCRSVPGRGSVFEFYLPLIPEQQQPELHSPHTPPATANLAKLFKDKNIVVVEDDDLVGAGMQTLLQELGASVQYFNDAEQALRYETIYQADYFIADYALGGNLNGLQFLQAVQQKSSKPIRAAVITGETSSQFISTVENSQWTVLHKPVNYAALATALE